jgi:hypothetical protein
MFSFVAHASCLMPPGRGPAKVSVSVRPDSPQTTRRLIPAHKENNMKQNARKNLQKRKRQEKRLAWKKYLTEKKSKAAVA